MSRSEDPLLRLVEIAEEQLRWQRVSVLPQARATIERVLTTTQLRTAYEMCNGVRSGPDIATAVGTTKQSVSNWTRRWRDLGIAFETTDRRIEHLVSLDALGLPVDLGDGSLKGKSTGKGKDSRKAAATITG